MGALGRTRTCDLLIRSHSHSGTGADMEGQGEAKPRFYRESGFLKRHRGTGRDTQLRSDCGQKLCKNHLINTQGITKDLLSSKYRPQKGEKIPPIVSAKSVRSSPSLFMRWLENLLLMTLGELPKLFRSNLR
jgi:hypothetical protein